MEENKLFDQSKWPLVESIAKVVYKNDIEVLTQADIKEIEASIDNGTPIFLKKKESGEMNLDVAGFLDVVTAGFNGIQMIASILSLWLITHNQSQQGQSEGEKIDSLILQNIIDKILNDNNVHDLIKRELKKYRDIIISAILAHLRLVNPNDSENEKKE